MTRIFYQEVYVDTTDQPNKGLLLKLFLIFLGSSRPVSTQENKHRIELDFFHLVLSTPPDQNKVKILQLFIIWVTDHRFKMRGFNFVPIRSDPILIFLSGNRPNQTPSRAVY